MNVTFGRGFQGFQSSVSQANSLDPMHDEPALPPSTQPASSAPGKQDPIKASNVKINWGTDSLGGVTATSKIQDQYGNEVATVVVNHRTDTVTVAETGIDPHTGKTKVDKNGDPLSTEFTLGDTDDNDQTHIDADGNLQSQEGRNPNNFFTPGLARAVVIGDGPNAVHIEVADNINGFFANGDSSGIGVVIFTPSKDLPASVAAHNGNASDVTALAAYPGKGSDGKDLDPSQLQAFFTHNFATSVDAEGHLNETTGIITSPKDEHNGLQTAGRIGEGTLNVLKNIVTFNWW